jgi:hypothetical protein
VRRLGGFGVDVTVHSVRRGPLVEAVVGPSGGPLVLLHGHLDARIGCRRAVDVRDDRLAGRNALDYAALAAMTSALPRIARQGRVRVALVVVADAEDRPPHALGPLPPYVHALVDFVHRVRV